MWLGMITQQLQRPNTKANADCLFPGTSAQKSKAEMLPQRDRLAQAQEPGPQL